MLEKLRVGGGGLGKLKKECGLTSLLLNHRGATVKGERLLRARVDFDEREERQNNSAVLQQQAPSATMAPVQEDLKHSGATVRHREMKTQ